MIRHGLQKHPLYNIWNAIRDRCSNINSERYHDYGGRGITVCDDWQNSFVSFYSWATSNGWQRGLDLDREDNDKGYGPENCRFVTRKVGNRNRRTTLNYQHAGMVLPVAEWAERHGIKYRTLWHRLFILKMDFGVAISKPRFK